MLKNYYRPIEKNYCKSIGYRESYEQGRRLTVSRWQVGNTALQCYLKRSYMPGIESNLTLKMLHKDADSRT